MYVYDQTITAKYCNAIRRGQHLCAPSECNDRLGEVDRLIDIVGLLAWTTTTLYAMDNTKAVCLETKSTDSRRAL